MYYRFLPFFFLAFVFPDSNYASASDSFIVTIIEPNTPAYSKPDDTSSVVGHLDEGDTKLIVSYYSLPWPKTYIERSPVYLPLENLRIENDEFGSFRSMMGPQDPSCQVSDAFTDINFSASKFDCETTAFDGSFRSCKLDIKVNLESTCENVAEAIVQCESSLLSKYRAQYIGGDGSYTDSHIQQQNKLFPILLDRGYASGSITLDFPFYGGETVFSAEVTDVECKLLLLRD